MTPFQLIIFPHTESIILWKETWEEAVEDALKTVPEEREFYLADLRSGRNGLLLMKGNGEIVIR